MNINCTNKCAHQVDGKCTLDTLAAGSFHVKCSEDGVCPYFV